MKKNKLILLLNVAGVIPLFALPVSLTTIKTNVTVDNQTYDQETIISDPNIYSNPKTISGYYYDQFGDGNYNWAEQGRYLNNDHAYYNNGWYRLLDPNYEGAKGLNNHLQNNYLSNGNQYTWMTNDENKNWWSGVGYNKETNSKKWKIAFHMDEYASNYGRTAFGAGFWISRDQILTGQIKITYFVKGKNISYETIGNDNYSAKKTFTINVNDGTNWDRNIEINPWVASVERINTAAQGEPLVYFDEPKYDAQLSNIQYWPNYIHPPMDWYLNFTNNGNDIQRVEEFKKYWGGYLDNEGRKVSVANLLINNRYGRDQRGGTDSGKKEFRNRGLYQKHLNESDFYKSFDKSMGSLFTFFIDARRRSPWEQVDAMAVVEFETKPYNDVMHNQGDDLSGEQVGTGYVYADHVTGPNESTEENLWGTPEAKNWPFWSFIGGGTLWFDGEYGTVFPVWGSFTTYSERKSSYYKKFITKEKLFYKPEDATLKSENDILPKTKLTLVEGDRVITEVDKSKFDEIKNQKLTTTQKFAEFSTLNNINSTTKIENLNNLRLKIEFADPEDSKKWKIKNDLIKPVSLDSAYWTFDNIQIELSDLEKLKRYIDTKEHLTNLQKQALKDKILSAQGFEESTSNFVNSVDYKNFKNLVNEWDAKQEEAENKYGLLKNYVFSLNQLPSGISEKMNFALADKELKEKTKKLLEENKNKYFLSPYSDIDRNNVQILASGPSNYNFQDDYDYENRTHIHNLQDYGNDLDNFIKNVNDLLRAFNGEENLNKLLNHINDFEITSLKYPHNNEKLKNLLAQKIQNDLNQYSTIDDLINFNEKNTELNNELNEIYADVEKLDNLNKVINQIYKQLPDITSSVVYKKTNDENLKNLDDAWFNSYLSNISSEYNSIFDSKDNIENFTNKSLNNLKTNWTDKLQKLNGNKDLFDSNIDSYTYLSDTEKNIIKGSKPTLNNFNFEESDNNFTFSNNLESNEERLNNLITGEEGAFAQAKKAALLKLESLSNMGEEKKAEIRNKINEAELFKGSYAINGTIYEIAYGNDKNIANLIEEQNRDLSVENELKESANALENISTEQGDKLNKYIENSTFDEASKNEFLDQLNALDEKMKALNDAIANLDPALVKSALSNNPDDQINKYKYATENKADEFKNALINANNIKDGLNSTIDPDEIQAAIDKLNKTANALDGDSYEARITNLEYLSDELKNKILADLRTKKTDGQRYRLSVTANKLNDLIKKYLDPDTGDFALYEKTVKKGDFLPYIEANYIDRGNFDDLYAKVNDQIENNKLLSSPSLTDNSDYTELIFKETAKNIKNLKDAYDKLVIDKWNRDMDKYYDEIDLYENLNSAQKDYYKESVRQKDADIPKIFETATIVDEKMKELRNATLVANLIVKEPEFKAITDNEAKADYLAKVENANRAINGIQTDNPDLIPIGYLESNNALNAREVDEIKDALIQSQKVIELILLKKEIDNLPYLSTNEKTVAKNKLNPDLDDEAIENIVDEVNLVNDFKKQLINEINNIPATYYSQETKNQHIQEIINKDANLDSENNITNISEFDAIVLQAKKENAKLQAENELKDKLNPKQYNDLIQAIDNASNSQDLANINNKYQDVAEKMTNLKNVVNFVVNNLDDAKYQASNNEKKNNFDTKLDLAKKLLTSTTDDGLNDSLNNLANLSDDNTNNNSLIYTYESLDGNKNGLKEIIAGNELLNDKEKSDLIQQIDQIQPDQNETRELERIKDIYDNLVDSKQDAINKINALTNLNQSQKDGLINEVKTKNADKSGEILEKATKLDELMKELKAEIAKEPDFRDSSDFAKLNETEVAKYEQVLDDAKKLLNNEAPSNHLNANLDYDQTKEIYDTLHNFQNQREAKIQQLLNDLSSELENYNQTGNNDSLNKIQEIIKNLDNLAHNTEQIKATLEIIKLKSHLKWLYGQWQNSDINNQPNTNLAREDLDKDLAKSTDLIANYATTENNENIKNLLISIKDELLNLSEEAQAETHFYDAMANYQLDSLKQNAQILNSKDKEQFNIFAKNEAIQKLFAVLAKGQKIDQDLMKEVTKVSIDDLNTIEKTLFKDILTKNADVRKNLSWLWWLLGILGIAFITIFIVLVLKKKKNKKSDK
ncbi:rhoptry family protein [Mycoplasmopsis gallinarum]|uniref:GA module-containing protein n=1 Tax=Mycoplasmopsis gallinarum TaxID=29557 RepID=UPI000487DF3C|nr:GA module-containing protein [Mycoplasmopsis gallinarum]